MSLPRLSLIKNTHRFKSGKQEPKSFIFILTAKILPPASNLLLKLEFIGWPRSHSDIWESQVLACTATPTTDFCAWHCQLFQRASFVGCLVSLVTASTLGCHCLSGIKNGGQIFNPKAVPALLRLYMV